MDPNDLSHVLFLWSVLVVRCSRAWPHDISGRCSQGTHQRRLFSSFFFCVTSLMKLDWSLLKPTADSIASVVFAGIVFGALTFGILSDKVGRRRIFLVTAVGTGVFGVASAFSPGVAVMILLRGCCGFFLGGGPIAYSMYLEFLPRQHMWVMTGEICSSALLSICLISLLQCLICGSPLGAFARRFSLFWC